MKEKKNTIRESIEKLEELSNEDQQYISGGHIHCNWDDYVFYAEGYVFVRSH